MSTHRISPSKQDTRRLLDDVAGQFATNKKAYADRLLPPEVVHRFGADVRERPARPSPAVSSYAGVSSFDAVKTQTYTIRKGDTLSGIARKFHTSVPVLAELNGVKNLDKIFAGGTLVVPT